MSCVDLKLKCNHIAYPDITIQNENFILHSVYF
jgi:hypothetical protein